MNGARMDQRQGPESRQTAAAVSRFQVPLQAYALKILGDPDRARDVVQETFATLCAQPQVGRNGHLAEWLYRVCRNKALDVRRKEKRVRPMTGIADEIFISPREGPAAVVERNEM